MGTAPVRRRLGAAVAALAALTGAAACGADTEPEQPSIDVTLDVTMTAGPDALRIEYTLVNRADEPVVVFAGIPARDTHENPEVDPNAAYVTARDDDTVEIAKRVFAPPEGVGLAVDFVVRGTVLQPRDDLREVLQVPLPLQPRHPYETDARLPEAARKAVFCVGVATQASVPPLPTASGESDPRPTFPHRKSIADVQRLVCGTPTDLP